MVPTLDCNIWGEWGYCAALCGVGEGREERGHTRVCKFIHLYSQELVVVVQQQLNNWPTLMVHYKAEHHDSIPFCFDCSQLQGELGNTVTKSKMQAQPKRMLSVIEFKLNIRQPCIFHTSVSACNIF